MGCLAPDIIEAIPEGRQTAAPSAEIFRQPIPLACCSVAVTGTNAKDFSQTKTCDSGLPPGGKCTITVTFIPTHIGSRSAAVTITDNAAGSANGELERHRVVSGPNATLSATSLTFATQPVGTASPPQPITLNNYGTVLPQARSEEPSSDRALHRLPVQRHSHSGWRPALTGVRTSCGSGKREDLEAVGIIAMAPMQVQNADTSVQVERRICHKSVTDSLRNTTSYQLDPIGNITKITDARSGRN